MNNSDYLIIGDEYAEEINRCTVNHIPCVLYAGKTEQILEYNDIWSLDATKILCIRFSSVLIKECGYINNKLNAGTYYEYLLRLIRYTGKCYIVEYQNELLSQTNIDYESLAETYAYTVKSHIDLWQKNGLTDKLFGNVCNRMVEYGVLEAFQKYFTVFLVDSLSYMRIASVTAPFIILRGDDTCIGVLQRFADEIAEALVNNKQAVIVLGNGNNNYDSLRDMIIKGIAGFQTKALEIPFFRKLNGPKFQFWMDYPLHFKDVLRQLGNDYYVLCQDGDYANQIREFYNTPGALHFPLGGIQQKWNDDERPYDIVFIGSYFESDISHLNDQQREYFEFMTSHLNMTFEDGLRHMLEERGAIISSDTFVELMYHLKPACRAIIGFIRKKVVCTILDAGYTIHVYGSGWNRLQANEYGNLIIHDEVSVDDSLVELRKAKVGLNVMSWHKNGMTERIANIMLSGAVCLSDETKYINANFSNGEDILLYNLEELDKLPQIIESVLRDVKNLKRVAYNGYIHAMKEYTWNKRAEELINIAEDYATNSTDLRVYVATHVSFNSPKQKIYVPLQVGREGKKDLGYINDNTGVNISDLNYLYGELTGLFWIWQNVQDVDYIGLCHYRRYFINDRMTALNEAEYKDILRKYDAIVPKHMECSPNYYEHFGTAHNKHDLDAVRNAIDKIYPEYIEAYDKAMEGDIFYYGNLMVTRKEILHAYAEWLFNIFIEASDEIDVSGYDAYHARVYGFLSEQMFYVFAVAYGLQLYECAVGVSGEKAETKDLINRLRVLINEEKKQDAIMLFEEQIKHRPDLLLPGSDINNDLLDIKNELYK